MRGPAEFGRVGICIDSPIFLEISSASHMSPTSYNTTMARYSIAWMKRFVDDDTR